MKGMVFVVLVMVVVQEVLGTQQTGSNKDFLELCLDLKELGIGLQCQGLNCRGEEGRLMGLEQLQNLPCRQDQDCRGDQTSLVCVKGRCSCPVRQAMNLTSCACQPAAACGLAEENCAQHNGRKCEDNYCSCFASPDYRTLLLDPTSLFCVLPGDLSSASLTTLDTPTPSSLGLTVLCTIGGLVCAVLITLAAIVAYRNCVICEKGDYKCEAPESDLPEVHVAAWDHPSLDYIPRGEEDIVFTLCQAKDTVRMSNASTIHVMDEDRMTTSYMLPGDDHDNMAYVDDDEPRHD